MSFKTGRKKIDRKIEKLFEYIWYQSRIAGYFFLPLAAVFCLLARLRKKWLIASSASNIDKPVIVVGNINVGGTGKTPLVIALVEHLQAQGLKPGVVSRGYGGKTSYPYQLDNQTLAAQSGDEPLLIFQRCACPVVVAPDRLQAIEHLLENNSIDIIISDDGLQHYAMPRQFEIVVVDGERGFGNKLCLPAGPLRETISRLQSVDIVVVNGGSNSCNSNPYLNHEIMYLIDNPMVMQLQTQMLKSVLLPSLYPAPTPAENIQVHAVAAIGNPERFFTTLEYRGFNIVRHSFPDHHQYKKSELLFNDALAVIMTEKDAVKCRTFTDLDNHWYLPINAVMPKAFWQNIDSKIKQLVKEN